MEDAVPVNEAISSTFGMAIFGRTHFSKVINSEDKVA
jgi:hypothetical protein